MSHSQVGSTSQTHSDRFRGCRLLGASALRRARWAVLCHGALPRKALWGEEHLVGGGRSTGVAVRQPGGEGGDVADAQGQLRVT